MPGDAVPLLTDETTQARFTHACRVPTRDGEEGVVSPSPLSQAVFRRCHPLFLVGHYLVSRRASRDTHAAFPSMSFAGCWGSQAFFAFDIS